MSRSLIPLCRLGLHFPLSQIVFVPGASLNIPSVSPVVFIDLCLVQCLCLSLLVVCCVCSDWIDPLCIELFLELQFWIFGLKPAFESVFWLLRRGCFKQVASAIGKTKGIHWEQHFHPEVWKPCRRNSGIFKDLESCDRQKIKLKECGNVTRESYFTNPTINYSGVCLIFMRNKTSVLSCDSIVTVFVCPSSFVCLIKSVGSDDPSDAPYPTEKVLF